MTEQQAWRIRGLGAGWALYSPEGELAFDDVVGEDFAAFIVNEANGLLQARADIADLRSRLRAAEEKLAVAKAALREIRDWRAMPKAKLQRDIAADALTQLEEQSSAGEEKTDG